MYTGRVSDQRPADQQTRESSELGFVWRSDIIEETLRKPTPDEKPEVRKGRVITTSFWEKAE